MLEIFSRTQNVISARIFSIIFMYYCHIILNNYHQKSPQLFRIHENNSYLLQFIGKHASNLLKNVGGKKQKLK
jgi:hypothetical protein